MRKEFNNLVALLQKEPYSNEVAIAIQKLENKIDEVLQRINCAVRSSRESKDSISVYTDKVDRDETFKMDVKDHDSILRASNDVIIALDLNDDMCVKDNWYNLFTPLQPIAVGKVEYDFPEEVYTIGNADNTEIIGDVYESIFIQLLEGKIILTENDKGFPGGKTNYVIIHEQFIPLIKFHQIDLSKVPIKREVFMTFGSSWGEIDCDEDGNVIEVRGDEEYNGERNYLFDIGVFDLAEYFVFLNSKNITMGEADDILSVGFWKKDNTYNEADKDWRKNMFSPKDDEGEAPTMLCQDKEKHDAVKNIIAKLKEIEVDGETMQYIIENLGMNDQMLRQLVLTNPYVDTADLLKEKEENPLH